MKTSRSIVLFGVSLRYLCQTCKATSCGDDFADNAVLEGALAWAGWEGTGVVLGAGLEGVC